jgi:hypothetical protein
MKPANALSIVRQLAADESSCELFGVVLVALRRYGLDSDDLREIIQHELGDSHCFKTRQTEKYYPATVSDYYSIWIDVCESRMFLKLLVVSANSGTQRLVITSFKKDTRYGH